MPLKGTNATVYHRHIYEANKLRFPLLARIQSKTETRSDTGSASYAWADVPGLTAVPCLKLDQQPSEVRTVDMIEAIDLFTIILRGYYPNIEQDWRIVIDGTIYNIIGTIGDSIKMFTKLVVRTLSTPAEAGV